MITRTWAVAVAAVGVLVAGCGGGGQTTETSTSTSTETTTVATPPPTSPPMPVPPGVAAPVLAPFVLTLQGDNVTVSGDVAEQSARTAVLDAIAGALGTDATVADAMTVNPGSVPFDPALVGNVVEAAKPVANFGLRRDPDRVTLTGTAPSDAEKAAVETAAKALFPELPVTNDITVG
ncbi:BON domain-containing protein [Mycobacterium sp. GA-2829]|uniref:channel-forming protein ArfA/OmpATb n=1 Tax=Mycobacterium sp. GA-2829 TaxID=1772283 RepID=UPI0007400B85|nr:BON domain-containing protein [Mycobacterium sp. GA-2829]KUI39443.1 hypothetical protein AU194_18875 [Mycobacterium sp. GA-2829]